MEIRHMKFSVLMSVYYKEKANYLEACLNSLVLQTVRADEWVIVKDGPISEELEAIIDKYNLLYPNLIQIIVFEDNQGLGKALAAGVVACKNSLIARMDTDDICEPNRFEMQLTEFIKDSHLDICGSYIKEFEGSKMNVVSQRLVPLVHDDIYKYQKRRSSFNHMTVMFKKESVLSAGNYQHALLMEDDLLWVHMLKNGCKGINIPKFLVYARVGKDMIERRGGYSYFKKYKTGRKVILNTGFITKWDYLYTIGIQLIVSLMPLSVRKYFFTHLLRNHDNEKVGNE